MLQRGVKMAGVVLLVIMGMVFVSVIFVKNRVSPQYATSDLKVGYEGAMGISVPSSAGVMSRESLQVAPAYDSAVSAKGTISTNVGTERMIVKTADIFLVVPDVYKTAKDIADFAEQNEGFVVNSYIYKMGLSPIGTVTIRVPGVKFESSLEILKKFGEVKSERSSGDDITEEYVDLDAQLKNFKAVEVQYLQILAKAQEISDILDVQRELTNVRLNIERLQGRMKFLKQSTDLSSITIQLAIDPENLPAYDEQNKWKPLAVIKEAVRALTDAGKQVVNLIIWFVIFIPVWLLIGVIAWGGYRVVKKYLNKQE